MGVAFVDSLIEHSRRRRRHGRAPAPRRAVTGSTRIRSCSCTSRRRTTASTRRALGHDRIEADGSDAGFYERASGTEICGYFDEIMRHRLLASGRVRFFPMCDYLGDRRFRSLAHRRGHRRDGAAPRRRRDVHGDARAGVRPATVRRRRRRAVRSRRRAHEGRARAGRLRDRRRRARPRSTRSAGCSIAARRPTTSRGSVRATRGS